MAPSLKTCTHGCHTPTTCSSSTTQTTPSGATPIGSSSMRKTTTAGATSRARRFKTDFLFVFFIFSNKEGGRWFHGFWTDWTTLVCCKRLRQFCSPGCPPRSGLPELISASTRFKRPLTPGQPSEVTGAQEPARREVGSRALIWV